LFVPRICRLNVGACPAPEKRKNVEAEHPPLPPFRDGRKSDRGVMYVNSPLYRDMRGRNCRGVTIC
jgi:hypothetical protein